MNAQRTGFFGLSHLGIVSSVGLASLGHVVVAIDRDIEKIGQLHRRRSPIFEPGLDEALQASAGRMTFGTDPALLAQSPLVILSQDLPIDDGGAADLTAIQALAEAVVDHLQGEATLIVTSQVPPGFTRSTAERIRRRRPDAGIAVYYWAETLITGQALHRFLHPERIILGCSDPTAPLPPMLSDLFRDFECPVLSMRYESAELTKMAINLYLASAVTYANTLADLCERIGADWSEMVPALRLDRRIGPAAYLRPGLGFAGGNLERDLDTIHRLAGDHAIDAALIDAIAAYNARRAQWVSRKLQQCVFVDGRTPTIAVWGLAYKKNTHSVKNAPSLRVLADLRGKARVQAYDPAVRTAGPGLELGFGRNRDDVLRGADCLLIMTDWDEFAEVDPGTFLRTMRRPLVIDCVGVLERRRATLDGVQYFVMGRGDVMPAGA